MPDTRTVLQRRMDDGKTERMQHIRVLIREGNARNTTKTGLKAVRKAAKALGFTPEEQIELEAYLEYRHRSTGELYPLFQDM